MTATTTTTEPSEKTPAPSVIQRTLLVHKDDRGSVRESFRASWAEMPPIRQLVHSESRPHVMRAMHAHKRQWDIWHFTKGERVLVQTYDIASGELNVMVATPGDTILIPPGVAHGFLAAFGCTLVYALTEEYDGTDEYGFNAYSPEYPGAKYWSLPSEEVLRSRRDEDAPSFRHFLKGWRP